jgi:hypothetical protein
MMASAGVGSLMKVYQLSTGSYEVMIAAPFPYLSSGISSNAIWESLLKAFSPKSSRMSNLIEDMPLIYFR